MTELLLDPRTWIAAIITCTAVYYTFHRWFWPRKRCKRCKGSGRRYAPFSRA